VVTTAPPPARERRRWSTIAIQVAAIVAIGAAAVWTNLYAADHDLFREAAVRFGYPGILLGGAASGFNLVVPVPIIAFFPFFVEVGFHPVVTVAVIATGMTLGDLLGYLIGHTARDVLAPRREGLVARLERMRERRPYLPFVVMFLYAAFAPIPNEVLVIPLAFLRYPVAAIFSAVLLGNLIFNSLVAFGVVHVFDLL
jgi:membrane protein YqaA with SNARE-associated domain